MEPEARFWEQSRCSGEIQESGADGPWDSCGGWWGGGQQLEDVKGHVLELRLAPVCVGACATGYA